MRLIDADELADKHCDGCSADIREMCKTDPVCASMMWVVEAPTVDAVKVVHGKWEWRHTNEYTQILTCSVCSRTEGADENHKYCPHCGARMMEVDL